MSGGCHGDPELDIKALLSRLILRGDLARLKALRRAVEQCEELVSSRSTGAARDRMMTACDEALEEVFEDEV